MKTKEISQLLSLGEFIETCRGEVGRETSLPLERSKVT